MIYHAIKSFFPQTKDLRKKQSNTIVLITFWSQFSTYTLNTILILFLTRPLIRQGLGYSDAKAYLFMGVTQATGYLMPLLGGFMADKVLGLRRAILLGSLMLAVAYLLLMLSAYSITRFGDQLFIAAYALIPVCNSLLMGTASGLISRIYQEDAINAKAAMTYYYMAINVGALLATIIAPSLLDSRFGPLSIFALTFVGKGIAALNFLQHYSQYDSVVCAEDNALMSKKAIYQLLLYLSLSYLFILLGFSHPDKAGFIISLGCIIGILWFFYRSLSLKAEARSKQLIAIFLIIEAIVFFVIYNQMNTTLVLFAQNNSDLKLLGFSISAAQYQMLNPLLIIAIGIQLPRLYNLVPQFTIPYQFAAGTMLAALALLLMSFACSHTTTGLVNGNYLGLCYVLITLGELWVSAIGLSMIGLYCDSQSLGFAMGVWYLACSLSNTISGRIAEYVAMPQNTLSALERLNIYSDYYNIIGLIALSLALFMGLGAYFLQKTFKKRGLILS